MRRRGRIKNLHHRFAIEMHELAEDYQRMVSKQTFYSLPIEAQIEGYRLAKAMRDQAEIILGWSIPEYDAHPPVAGVAP